MYKRTFWQDEVRNPDRRVTMTSNSDGTYTVTKAGTLMQEGTPQDEEHFNNLENGISDATTAIALLFLATDLMRANLSVEEHKIILANTQRYPFNNSAQTIALSTTRDNTEYSVAVDVEGHTGNVGDITIYDKAVNGFKIRFDGSGSAVAVTLRVTGGM